VIAQYWELYLRSALFAVLTTVVTLAVGYPVAYTIAFRGGRLKIALLLLVVLPFFVSFVIRTLNWRMILSDNGMVFGFFKDLGLLEPNFHFLATPASVIFGLTYNFLPFMILPIYASLERIDLSLIEAAKDLYASARQAFLKVTLPLTAPGIVAGVLLTFIPIFGDYINAELLGSPNQAMIGNKIQSLYLEERNYPEAAALSFLMMAAVLILVLVYIRAAGTEAFMGDEEEG
jgi:spermidine/putrescine transport system permease protein